MDRYKKIRCDPAAIDRLLLDMFVEAHSEAPEKIILDRLEGPPPRGQARLADRVLVLAANRLCAPSSEHGLARWLETEFVCDRRGRRWLPAWRDDDERRRSRRPRVRVQDAQLNGWYRTLDALAAHKTTIEKQLFLRLRDLFSLRAEMVFYDLTSTYFQGSGPAGLARHGYSRDGKPRQRQVFGRGGAGRRLADRPSCVSRQLARRPDGRAGARGPAAPLRPAAG